MRWISCGLAGLLVLGVVTTQGGVVGPNHQRAAGDLANGGVPACASCHGDGNRTSHFWTHWSAPAHRAVPGLRRG